jgi:hypothetical protein
LQANSGLAVVSDLTVYEAYRKEFGVWVVYHGARDADD